MKDRRYRVDVYRIDENGEKISCCISRYFSSNEKDKADRLFNNNNRKNKIAELIIF